MDINIEGVNWNVKSVLNTDKKEDDFVNRHMSDSGTYPKFDKEKKEKTLRLVWSLVSPIKEVIDAVAIEKK